MERPILETALVDIPEIQQKTLPNERSKSWVSKTILKSYLSSFNLCLDDLGWVPQRILEVGSGDGSWLAYLGQLFMNAELTGVEFDAAKIEQAKEQYCCRPEYIQLTDAETLPFENNRFDLVISHGFLGQSPIPRHWLKEMARVSAEGLILSVPTPIGYRWLQKLPGAKHASLMGRPVFQPNIQPISMQQLRGWTERLGLVTEVSTTPVPFGMLMLRKPQQRAV